MALYVMKPSTVFLGMIGGTLLLSACGAPSGNEPMASSTTWPVVITTSSTTLAPTTTTSKPPDASSCDLVTPEMVETAYGGDVDQGIEGYADNCTYWIDGADVAVSKIDIFDLGPATGWEGLLNKQVGDWGEIIEVEGIGENAFHPVYHKGRDLFFQTDDRIYSIVSFGGVEGESLDNVTKAVLSLASAIVDQSDAAAKLKEERGIGFKP